MSRFNDQRQGGADTKLHTAGVDIVGSETHFQCHSDAPSHSSEISLKPPFTESSVEQPSELNDHKLPDNEAREAIDKLRRIRRDENVPLQYRRYSKAMQLRIGRELSRNEHLLLALCEEDRGNIVVTVVEEAVRYQGTTGSQLVSSKRRRQPKKTFVESLLGAEYASIGSRIVSHLLSWCWRLCTSQFGCVAMQRLMDVMDPRQRIVVEDFVIDHFLALAVHPFGNFMVQKIMCSSLDGGVHRALLIHVSMPDTVMMIGSTKFGSHVLECFFRVSPAPMCLTAMRRLLAVPEAAHFLCNDLFGNYVLQQFLCRVESMQRDGSMYRHMCSGEGNNHSEWNDEGGRVMNSREFGQFLEAAIAPHLDESPLRHKLSSVLLGATAAGTR